MLGSYNAGPGTLLRARSIAEQRQLDPSLWTNIRKVARDVPRWKCDETFFYVERTETNIQWLSAAPPPGVRKGKHP